MLITKTSNISGQENTLDLDITQDQLDRVNNRFNTTELIQNIVPNLTPGEREFLITGITEQEWDELYGEEGE
jgi:hypothetical protein